MLLCSCGSQRTTSRNWFSPSILWVPGIELGLTGIFYLLTHLVDPKVHS